MIISAPDTDLRQDPAVLLWDRPQAHVAAREDDGASALRRVLHEPRDTDGFIFPLLRELTVTFSPPRGTPQWRTASDAFGTDIVGRGSGPRQALGDWRKRFANAVARILEMRPFEMTSEDRDFYTKVFKVIDLGAYRATKPYEVRQAGTVLKHTGHAKGTSVVVKWEDGKVERINAGRFDEAITRYPLGQHFEILARRHPVTTRLLRAYALRKLNAPSKAIDERSNRLWEDATSSVSPVRESSELDEQFWGIQDS